MFKNGPEIDEVAEFGIHNPGLCVELVEVGEVNVWIWDVRSWTGAMIVLKLSSRMSCKTHVDLQQGQVPKCGR